MSMVSQSDILKSDEKQLFNKVKATFLEFFERRGGIRLKKQQPGEGDGNNMDENYSAGFFGANKNGGKSKGKADNTKSPSFQCLSFYPTPLFSDLINACVFFPLCCYNLYTEFFSCYRSHIDDSSKYASWNHMKPIKDKGLSYTFETKAESTSTERNWMSMSNASTGSLWNPSPYGLCNIFNVALGSKAFIIPLEKKRHPESEFIKESPLVETIIVGEGDDL